uniref:Uncharacterized protein n=1 Tax=Amphimedon queenslandica TaxID=400682 RepID=A0A1X7UVT0_AMPQE
NFYTNLFKDSVDVAQKLGSDLSTTVSDIANLHTPFMKSSLPITLQDMLINSLSHVRSAFWLNDGRWRQWEAYDCVNIDSVHNDGERHIPYISIFPNSTISKLYAWAKYQESNGMIQEQLRCGCMTMTDKSPRVDSGCGRAMCDVSSMFIVYLLELLTWHDDPYSQQVVRDLYNASKKAAQWHMSVSTAEGIPLHLVDTYDIVNLAAYPYDTYSGSFHLLAMKAAETLAYAMGMYLPINALMIHQLVYNGFRTPFSMRSRSKCQFLYHSPVKTILISLALVFLLLCIWFWPPQQIQIYNYYNSSKEGNINSEAVATNAAPLKIYSQDESLVNLLGNLTFKNYGIVRSSDHYVWKEIRISYVEAQNVSGPYLGWADIGHANYLYHDVSGDLTHPASGMRSSVPLGGKYNTAP